MTEITTEKYREEAVKGIKNTVLQDALTNLQERFGRGTADGYKNLPEGPELRQRAQGDS